MQSGITYRYGSASWYTTCNLSTSGPPNGACATCYRDLGGIAYPSLQGFPGNYASSCTYMPPVSCGTYLGLTNLCTPYGVASEVVDHGPGAACTLDPDECLPNVWDYRLIDLTPYTFQNAGGSLWRGLTILEIGIPV